MPGLVIEVTGGNCFIGWSEDVLLDADASLVHFPEKLGDTFVNFAFGKLTGHVFHRTVPFGEEAGTGTEFVEDVIGGGEASGGDDFSEGLLVLFLKAMELGDQDIEGVWDGDA